MYNINVFKTPDLGHSCVASYQCKIQNKYNLYIKVTKIDLFSTTPGRQNTGQPWMNTGFFKHNLLIKNGFIEEKHRDSWFKEIWRPTKNNYNVVYIHTKFTTMILISLSELARIITKLRKKNNVYYKQLIVIIYGFN